MNASASRGSLSSRVLRTQSDKRLVTLTRSGSSAAFGAIVERYRGPMLAYCRRLLRPDEAEDAVQQTFANALPALRADDRPVTLRPWLYRIAHNVSVNTLSRRGRDYEQLDEQYDGVPQPPQVFEQRERVRDLVAAIGDLPDRQRTAILASELEGRSHEEIAAEMGASKPIVRQLVHRARIRLRDACGFLVPVSWMRWIVAGDLRGPAADRLGEAVAGGGAGAGLLKAGAVVMTTGALATGGLMAGGERFDRHRHETRAEAKSQVLASAPAPSSAPSAADHAPSAPRDGGDRGGSAGPDGDRSGSTGKTSHDGGGRQESDDAARPQHRERDHGDSGDESSDESKVAEPHESSHESGDSEGDGSSGSGDGDTESAQSPDSSGSSDGSGSGDAQEAPDQAPAP